MVLFMLSFVQNRRALPPLQRRSHHATPADEADTYRLRRGVRIHLGKLHDSLQRQRLKRSTASFLQVVAFRHWPSETPATMIQLSEAPKNGDKDTTEAPAEDTKETPKEEPGKGASSETDEAPAKAEETKSHETDDTKEDTTKTPPEESSKEGEDKKESESTEGEKASDSKEKAAEEEKTKPEFNCTLPPVEDITKDPYKAIITVIQCLDFAKVASAQKDKHFGWCVIQKGTTEPFIDQTYSCKEPSEKGHYSICAAVPKDTLSKYLKQHKRKGLLKAIEDAIANGPEKAKKAAKEVGDYRAAEDKARDMKEGQKETDGSDSQAEMDDLKKKAEDLNREREQEFQTKEWYSKRKVVEEAPPGEEKGVQEQQENPKSQLKDAKAMKTNPTAPGGQPDKGEKSDSSDETAKDDKDQPKSEEGSKEKQDKEEVGKEASAAAEVTTDDFYPGICIPVWGDAIGKYAAAAIHYYRRTKPLGKKVDSEDWADVDRLFCDRLTEVVTPRDDAKKMDRLQIQAFNRSHYPFPATDKEVVDWRKKHYIGDSWCFVKDTVIDSLQNADSWKDVSDAIETFITDLTLSAFTGDKVTAATPETSFTEANCGPFATANSCSAACGAAKGSCSQPAAVPNPATTAPLKPATAAAVPEKGIKCGKPEAGPCAGENRGICCCEKTDGSRQCLKSTDCGGKFGKPDTVKCYKEPGK
ncbi:unnamed protein product [Vitrella brassicaformis CCMP3155]|uniref:Uncharacterized protein n=1 Tax=Vitrella brassicaformis (strain CCMP3155) TaxID=1169540 RepID=A0A0G4H3L2_VITBC|nr:unnamed protein product [Vitrella brassicaformis CCMP3155]|eukprot:CEM38209.1 unnamed protein product [Vitrella brassicaformis CCMP3155]